MSTPIPPPLRAAAGLAAVVIDSARKLPEQLVGLPVLAVSTALQASLKAQQRYAELVARGDEVLAQLRGVEEAPAWARFDEDPAGTRPQSAFDAAAAPASAPPEDVLDELAADQLGGGEPEADLLADAEAGLDADGPVLEPDGVTATEAAAGGLDVSEVPLGTEPGVDLPASASREPAPGPEPGSPDGDVLASSDPVAEVGREPGSVAEAGREPGSVTEAGREPGSVAEAGREPGSVTEPGVDLPAGLAEDAEDAEAMVASADPAAGLDGYLAVEPPIARYDELSIPQLRGRLRSLSEGQIEELIAYERSTAARPPYLTMLENRLVTLRSR